MLVSGFKLIYVQAKIKAKTAVEYPKWNTWSLLRRICRRKRRTGTYTSMDGKLLPTWNHYITGMDIYV